MKAGLTGLMYGFAASLCYLFLRDVIDIFNGYAFLGTVTLALHLSFCGVAPLFKKFKDDDCMLPAEDEDPEVHNKILKMKLGGGFCCCAAISSILLPFYTLNQILVAGLYVYLVFVKYKNGADDDQDDKFRKMAAD